MVMNSGLATSWRSGMTGSLLAINEQRVAQAGADGEGRPAFDVFHARDFAQTLHHRVVVHHDCSLMVADARDRFEQYFRQIEGAAFPVARQILSAAFDRPGGVDLARTANADEWREP